MDKTIDFRKNIKELADQDPKIIEIMKELGFIRITYPGMINTIGRVMTIPKGCKMQNIDLELVKAKFIENGYRIIHD